jgi:hypothetical protein
MGTVAPDCELIGAIRRTVRRHKQRKEFATGIRDLLVNIDRFP